MELGNTDLSTSGAVDSYLFWGKTRIAADGNVVSKPILHHLMDVAAVAWQLTIINRHMCSRLSQQLQIGIEKVPGMVAFLAGLHDIGKFTVPFQAKSGVCWPEAILGKLQPADVPPGPGHWQSSALYLRHGPIRAIIESLLSGLNGLHQELEALVAGHHGLAPDRLNASNPVLLHSHPEAFTPPCIAAAITAVEIMRDHSGVTTLPEVTPDGLCRASFALNGLLTVADWVGSDEAFFPILATTQTNGSAAAYWAKAKERAAEALKAKGLVASTPCSAPDYTTLDLPCAAAPRPMQSMAAQADISDDGPQLFIIEDTTGSGKTEAALLLAARLMARGKAEGLYFALPTTATANAMHGRLLRQYQNFFAGKGDKPSLVLAHGRSSLARRVAALQAEGADQDSTSAFCNGWIADSRRLALFADIGVGTIDQAFLGIIRKRFLTLRQFALSSRVLIVDEAHAFDAYMGKELETLLQVHAMNGGSAIVLSATLPQTLRDRMTDAFAKPLLRRRLGGNRFANKVVAKQTAAEGSAAYPLLTSVCLTPDPMIHHMPVAFDRRLARTVQVKRASDRQAAMAMARGAAEKGAAVAIICNAVDEAIAVYEQLAELGQKADKMTLFHARFAMGDRMAIEADVLARFGKDSHAQDRAGHIVVATQVIEQSLDLDFDFIISDLAPVDLIIQRAGRLWRHMDQRPASGRPLPEPVIAIVSPDPAHVHDDKWLEPVLGKAAAIYRDPTVMWRSARLLFAAGRISVPDDLRPLVEGVYGEAAERVPDCLEARSGKVAGERGAQVSLATWNVIGPERGYSNLDQAIVNNDETVPTRDGEATVTIRLARRQGNRLIPYFQKDGADDRLLWELSEVSVRKKMWEKVSLSNENAALIADVRCNWPDSDHFICLAEVSDGTILQTRDALKEVTYNSRHGLCFL